MKSIIIVIIHFFILSISFSHARAPLKATLVRSVVPVKNEDGEVLFQQQQYTINCILENEYPRDTVTLVENWRVYNNNSPVDVNKILWRSTRAKQLKLIGSFTRNGNYTIQFLEHAPVGVELDSNIVKEKEWGFGSGKAIDFKARRIAEQKSKLAFDYDFNVGILSRYFWTVPKRFWIHSFSFDIQSNGIFGSDDTIRNGTQTDFAAEFKPYYFLGGLIYRGNLRAAYRLETSVNSTENRLFEIINKTFSVGMDIEIPFTNYPIFLLHTKTGYARLAMPLTIRLDYLFEGEDQWGNNTLSRLDLKTSYELAFSPYLLLQGEWHISNFFNAPDGVDDNASFYSVTIAQDLDVIGEKFDMLKLILGNVEKARGKHFIFYKITVGKTSPAFQDIREQSFGFGLYL